jgi:hypothetical protein
MTALQKHFATSKHLLFTQEIEATKKINKVFPRILFHISRIKTKKRNKINKKMKINENHSGKILENKI